MHISDIVFTHIPYKRTVNFFKDLVVFHKRNTKPATFYLLQDIAFNNLVKLS